MHVHLKRQEFEALLLRRNLSKTDLARLTGMNRSYLSDLLSGRATPGPEIRRRLLRVLEATFEEIFEIREHTE